MRRLWARVAKFNDWSVNRDICLESIVKNERKNVNQKMEIPNSHQKGSCIGRAPMELFLDYQENCKKCRRP